MLDEKVDATHNEPIEGARNMQIGDVVVERVRSKDVQRAIVILKNKFYNKNLMMLHLLSIVIKHFIRKWDLGMHKNLIKLR